LGVTEAGGKSKVPPASTLPDIPPTQRWTGDLKRAAQGQRNPRGSAGYAVYDPGGQKIGSAEEVL
jgi:hypothetical protein